MAAASESATATQKLATSCISSQFSTSNGSSFSPSLSSLLSAFEKDGDGDKDLLKALLNAKAKEDERLASADMLRAEQIRAATFQAYYWANIQAMQQQHQAQQYPAYSPILSPVSLSVPENFDAKTKTNLTRSAADLSASPENQAAHTKLAASPPMINTNTKRSRAGSETSSTSSSRSSISTAPSSIAEENAPKAKKVKKSAAPATKPTNQSNTMKSVTHEQAMTALRNKCHARQQQKANTISNLPSKARLIAPKPAAASPAPAIRVSPSPAAPAPANCAAGGGLAMLLNASKHGSAQLEASAPEITAAQA